MTNHRMSGSANQKLGCFRDRRMRNYVKLKEVGRDCTPLQRNLNSYYSHYAQSVHVEEAFFFVKPLYCVIALPSHNV